MKPLKLTVNDFGPFRGHTVIDFSVFYNSDIFLITGDTGAGKSTVFDAVVFALYGRASGSRREPDDFITDYEKNPETYVILEFLHQGKEYVVERGLKQIKGKTSRKTAVLRILGEERKISDGKKETDKAVEELLGITSEQFRQIVVLAQGEFMNFLVSDAKEKTKILSTVFGTSRFSQLKLKLSELSSAANHECSVCDERLKTHLSYLKYNGDNLPEYDFLNMDRTEETIEIFSELEKENNKKAADLSKRYKDFAERSEKITGLLVRAENLAEEKKELKSLEEKISDVSKNIKDNKSKLENALALKKDIDEKALEVEKAVAERAARIAAKEAILPKFQTAKIIKDEITLLEKKKNAAASKIAGFEKDIAQFEKKSAEYNEKTVKSEDKTLEVLLAENKSALDIIIKERKIAENMEVRLENLKNAKEISIRKKAELIRKNKDYEEKKSVYDLNRNLFFKNQAAFLADKIRNENIPCPVCGAVEFVLLAEYSGEKVTQEQVEKYKEQMDGADKEAKAVLADCKGAESKYATLRLEIEKDFVVFERKFNEDEAESIVNEYINEKAQIEKVIKIKIKELEKIIKNNNDCKIKIEEISRQLEKLKADKDNLKKEFDYVNNVLSGKQGELNAILPEIEKFGTIDDADREIKRLGKFISDYEARKNRTSEIISKLSEQEVGFRSALAENKKSFELQETKMLKIKRELEKGLDSVDYTGEISVKEINILLDSLKESLEEIQNSIQAVKSISERNTEEIKNIKKLSRQRKEKYAYASMLTSLYKTAAGTVSSTARVDFESFILSYYFSEVIAAADKRLDIMTDGRYGLTLKKNDKNEDIATLDLDVFDRYTGKQRAVSSMSGGELFKCALSMALGLSDIIQNRAGGVELDAIFIDEGFGSLDDLSRQQAMNAIRLSTGKNKLVGIISHVTELKDEIQSKIIVSKSPDGSFIEVRA